MSEFKLWNEINPNAEKVLRPDFGLRDWSALNPQEKSLMWAHLGKYFSDGNLSHVIDSISALNRLYKAKSFGRHFLTNANYEAALKDFYHIFMNESTDVVLQMFSIYLKSIFYAINTRTPKFEKDVEKWRRENIEHVMKDFNDVFSQFGLNVHITRNGIIPKQDRRLTEDIYVPVLAALSSHKWAKVNQLLFNSFDEYKKNTKESFGTCITHAISALEAFLQITLGKKIGEGKISVLIPEAQKKGLIPSDSISREICRSIESVLAQERKEKGNAHPSVFDASEKSARLVMNLVMVFLQHCL